MDKLQYLNKSVSVSYIAQGTRSLFSSFQYLLSLRTEINCLSAEAETHNNTEAEYAFLSIAIRQIGAMSSEAANNYHWVISENSQSAWTKLEFIGVSIKFAQRISQILRFGSHWHYKFGWMVLRKKLLETCQIIHIFMRLYIHLDVYIYKSTNLFI